MNRIELSGEAMVEVDNSVWSIWTEEVARRRWSSGWEGNLNRMCQEIVRI